MMNLALFTLDGFMFVLRWLHVFFGLIWIGHLYYFNFTQGAFFKVTDATTKSAAIRQLVPVALWWFRWGAMFTWITGVLMLTGYAHMSHYMGFANSTGVIILLGSVIATLMWANVWFVIWPAQKVVIADAEAKASGKPGIEGAAARASRAMVASRTNVLFSMPMLFMMLAARHLGIDVNPECLTTFWIVIAVLFGALEFNALKGKLGPLESVKGVVHMGVILTIVTYLITEFLL